MNRTILIAICDFLVLATLSISDSGGSVAQPQLQIKSEHLSKLEQSVDQQNLEQSPDIALLDEILEAGENAEKSSLEAAMLKNQLDATQASLASEKEQSEKLASQNKLTVEALAQTTSQLKSSEKSLAESNQKVQATEASLVASQEKLKVSKASNSVLKKENVESKQKLATLSQAFQKKAAESQRLSQQLAAQEKVLAEREAALAASEKLAQETKEKLLRQEALTEKVRAEAALQVLQLEKRSADLEVARKKAELEQQKTQENLNELEEFISNNPDNTWLSSQIQIITYIRETTFIKDFEFKEDLRLPVIESGGRLLLIGDATLLGFNWFPALNGQNKELDTVSYTFTPPDAREYSFKPDYAYFHKEYQDMVFFEIPQSIKGKLEPMKVIGFKDLKKLGLDGARLYRSSGESSEVTASFVDERTIKVKRRWTDKFAAQYNPEKGDYLLAKNGYLIGFLVDDETCLVFSDHIRISDKDRLPLKPVEKYRTEILELRGKN